MSLVSSPSLFVCVAVIKMEGGTEHDLLALEEEEEEEDRDGAKGNV